MYPLVLDIERVGVGRARIHAALEAEGVTGLAAGYANLHLLPMYQQKIAYGSRGFPWTSDICHRDVGYAKGICPSRSSSTTRPISAMRCVCTNCPMMRWTCSSPRSVKCGIVWTPCRITRSCVALS